ncbi:HlyD family type I secretion periplasmic adaptor subunit [Mesorhizobium sp. LjNodule214]|uniref:HlyD family type I secretion periplasmic adaptor subunit n=1 Tax=Mesorhizobium sp. LjNodule214 TaxID=3342252 RepID=UPI003ECC6A6A
MRRSRLIGAKVLADAGIFVIGFGAACLRWLESTSDSARQWVSSARTCLAGITANFPSIVPVGDRLRAGWMALGAVMTRLRGSVGAASSRNGESRRFSKGLWVERATIGWNRTVTNALASIPALPTTPFHRLRLLFASAFAVVGVFMIGFGVWAAYAPLESAAIAAGAIEAESSRKTIQHLEGGIVGRILVNDGDEVVAGQPLIGLDDTKARATVQMLQMQLWDAQALEARLVAERDDRERIQFPQDIVAAARQYPAAAGIVAGQTRIFDTRRRLNSSRIDMIQRRIAQTEQEIAGLRFQANAATSRATIVKGEIADVAPLVAKRLLTRSRLRQLEREQAEIDGRIGEATSQISRAEQAVGESQAMIFKLESDHQSEVAQNLRDTQAQILQFIERIQAARDVLARTMVRAPEAGTITDLRIHTTGGVIAPGEPLLDLVPSDDRLIVLVQVKPEDIDLVRPGLPARVRLLSYKHRRVPPVEGVLTYVSADRLIDSETRRPYYTARVRISEASLRALPEVDIMPGMPVEVLIKTGQFTVAHYTLRPVFDAFDRAFRED